MEKKHFDQSDRLNEGKKVTLKRRYTENHPAITAGKSARIRNKMLEAIADGKITQDEFNAMLSELSADSKRWLKRNSKFFNVSEEGVTLTKSGTRVLNQIKTNTQPNVKKLVMESFSSFINNEPANEINEGYVKTRGFKETEDRIERLMTSLRPDSMLCKSISKKADNVAPEFKKMQEHIEEIMDLWNEVNYTIDMQSNYESLDTEPLCEATVTMDAMAPDDRNFLRFLDKNKVEIIDTTKSGPMGHPEITMQGKRKDLEKVLADCNFGWCDEDLAEYIEESVINEAFKSSKLRNLVNMDQSAGWGKARHLAGALYGLSKIKLDQIEDNDLVDLAPKFAYKDLRKNRDYVVFYIVDNEKENPYADKNSYGNQWLKPGILAVSRGSDFLGVNYNQRDSRSSSDKRGGKVAYDLGKAEDSAIGGNKKYRGYSATGIYTVKRASELADRTIAIDITAMGKSAQDLIKQRAEAQEGAIAFKNDKDFKKANMQRYKDILATKASKMPLDKMVEDAINTLTKHIADAMKSGNKTQYGEIKIGEDKRGRDIKLTDASNIMSSILGDYERYVRYVADDEKEKGTEYYSGYYEKEMKEYAKRVSDRVKKVKDMDYAW